MKLRNLFFCLLLIMGAFAISAPVAEASSACALPVTNTCEGWSQVSTKTGGVLPSDERCFSVKTVNSAPACSTTTSNLAWEADGGACITAYYFDVANGATAPAAPNKVTLVMREPGNLDIKQFLNNGAEPANGASFSFCATDTGNAGGVARAGTYHMLLIVIKDNGAGGIGNYNIRDDGTATVGATSSFDRGVLRYAQHVANIARSAYPAGSTFSFGTAGNEQITITSTFDSPNNDKATSSGETTNNGVVTYNGGALGAAGAGGGATDETIGQTTLAQSVTVDGTNTPPGNSPYVAYYQIDSNAVLTGLPWTTIATTGNGANVVRFSSTFSYNSVTFNVDPSIIADSTGTNTFAGADDMFLEKLGSSSGAAVSLFNRGEAYYAEAYYLNSRGEKLSRALTLTVLDAGANTCISVGSVTPVSNKYSYTATVPTGGTCAAVATSSGSPRYISATATGQSHTTLQTYSVSSLYFVDAHIELSATLNKDNYPTENANEDVAYIISNAQTDTTHGWCHVVSVRKDLDIDTSGSVITWSYIDPASTTRLTGTTDTGSDGWTATHLDLLASTPLGGWTFRCASASFNGNSGTNDQAFTVSVPTGTGGGFPGDPIRIFCPTDNQQTGSSVRCIISESLLDGTARTGNAAATQVYIRDASNTLVVNGLHPTEWQFGTYYYDYTPTTLGTFTAQAETLDVATSNPIGSSNGFYVVGQAEYTVTPWFQDTP